MKEKDTVSQVVRFSRESLKKIKVAQSKLIAMGEPHSKGAAANYIIENSKVI